MNVIISDHMEEKLLYLVEQNAMLWNKSHALFRRTDLCDAKWNAIGRAVGCSGKQASHHFYLLKRRYKWNKKTCTGVAGVKKHNKSFAIMEKMKFLDACLRTRPGFNDSITLRLPTQLTEKDVFADCENVSLSSTRHSTDKVSDSYESQKASRILKPLDSSCLYDESSRSDSRSYNYPESPVQEPMTVEHQQVEASTEHDSFVPNSEYASSQSLSTQHPRNNHRYRSATATSASNSFRQHDFIEPHSFDHRAPIDCSTYLTKQSKDALVDGFCTYLAMQLKCLPTPVILDIQLDVQKIVLQAQQSRLHFNLCDRVEGERDLETGSTKAQMMNTNDKHYEQEPYNAIRKVATNKKDSSLTDEIEVYDEYWRIKSEPIDDDQISDGSDVPDPPDSLKQTSTQASTPNPTQLPSFESQSSMKNPLKRPASKDSLTNIATAQLNHNKRRLSTTVH